MSRPKFLLMGGVLLAFAVRVPGMFHDFWFDEAWSYLLVQEFVASPLDIVTRLHIDNNHPINSLFLYVIGPRDWWPVYRIPSLVFGVASVIVAVTIMARRGRAHAIAAAILFGCSYPLIVYATEARGYAAMVFFVLVAIDAHDRYLAHRQRPAVVMFWIAVILGFASHLTFLHAYVGLLCWSLYESLRSRDQAPRISPAALHAVPLLFLAGFYLIYVRHLRVAGAEPAPLPAVIGETLAVAIGVPGRGPWVWIAAAVVTLIVIEGLRIVRRTHSGIFAFFVTGMLLAPAIMVFIELRTALIEPRFFPRYFLVSMTLFLLLTAWMCGEHYQRGAMRAIGVMALLCVSASGNLWQTALFVNAGRGHYRDTVRYLAEQSDGREIRVSSNSDFRTSQLLSFYRHYLPPDMRLLFYPLASGGVDAEWRIVEDVEPRTTMPAEIDDGRGGRFRLTRQFPFYGLSGSQWTLYRRVGDTAMASRSGRQLP